MFTMWSTPAACMVCVLFGVICEVKQVDSQPKLIQRQSNQTSNDGVKLEDIQKVIDQINSLSDESENTRSVSSIGIDLDAYYDALSSVYAVFVPLLRERFIDDLPKMLVCILSGRQDCGLEAELTKAVSLELGKPLLALVSSLRSQTCTPPSSTEESSSFMRAYLRMGDSTSAALNSFQETLISVLSSLPLPGNLIRDVSEVVDKALTYVSAFMATFLQIPLDYINIALQFGIRVPSLDGKETCEHGDLKQLIMWGMNHNISWSFSNAIINILLENFLAPEQCTYPGPECQNPTRVPFQRSASEEEDTPDYNHDIVLKCDRHNLARLNDTLCADILTGSRVGSSASVLSFCQALSSLSPNHIERVWSNMCYIVQSLVPPVLGRSSDCSSEDTQPFPAATPPSETHHRAVREVSSLQQLGCNYNSWLENEVVDPVLVSLCSDNEREEFVKQVCNNALLMRKLLSDQMNSWLYGYCANSSADPGYMVSQFCVYEQWIEQPSVHVGPSLLELCMSLDSPRLTTLICEHTGFFMLLFSNPENMRFMPNCTNLAPPPFPNMDGLMLDSCRYSEWHDLTQITTDVLSHCIRLDQGGFTREVCLNKTFLNSLLRNEANAWLESHCNSSLTFAPPEPTQFFNIAGWCDYHTWGERQVDDSVVALCWNHDQLAFQENVCCKALVFDKLLLDPLNQWLTSVCTDKREIEEIAELPQVCRYSEWTRPIIVDMTELALCAEMDPLNFTSKVCANDTILQNLLANQDNTWLIQYCANHSNPGVPPDGGQGGGLTGFNPAEQCQYSSWSISLPDAALLTLCWEQDQTSFVSSICPNAGLLLLLSGEPSSMWVVSMCTTYKNYTTSYTNYTTTNSSSTAEPTFCPARNLVKQFNWTCSADFTSACQPGASQSLALQMLVHCWVESMRTKVKDLLPPPVATMLEQAVSTAVVVLLALEEVQNTSLHVTENIRLSVLSSVGDYLERENNFDKKRVLLQCFGKVLTSLMQTARDVSSEEFFVIKEYFKIPLSYLRLVLRASHITTVRLILQYYSRNKSTVQLPDKYLSTMVSVLFQTHMVKDGSLFPEVAPLLAAASPADIQALPSLQNNINVRETINSHLQDMTAEQRQAFGLWYSRVLPPIIIIGGHQSLIRDTGNLIAYLPFHNFQHLSSAQLLDGLDVLQRNTLTSLKQEFVAQSLIGTYRNLTAQDFTRLGSLSCLADPEDLLVYKDTKVFPVIRHIVMNCTREGLSLPSFLISSLLPNSTELKAPSSLSPDRLAELGHLLPLLGVTFLQNVTSSQLLAALPALESVSFSPAQASIIVEKMSSSTTPTAPGQLQLGSLIVGMKTETLLNLTSDMLLSSLPTMAQHLANLSPPQVNVISTKLWGFIDVVGWQDDVEPLLDWTPLLSVLSRVPLLVNNITSVATRHWNTQQAKALFKQVLDTQPYLIKEDLLSLGTMGQGVSCQVLQECFWADSSPSAVRRILVFLRQQPGPLHTSLKKCVIEELYQFEFFPELLEDLGAEIALSMPVSSIKKFPTDMMDTFRRIIVQEPQQFLMLSRTKQELLVDKIVQRMGMYTGLLTAEEFHLLGIMAPFVVDEVFNQLDRSFFLNHLDFLQGLCYSSSKMDIVARILQEPAAFGPVNTWNKTTLSQVDRFLLFLPNDKLKEISLHLMTVGRIEKLFMSQRRWERGDVGTYCLDQNERRILFEKQQLILQFFLGFLKISPGSPTATMVPTCEILHTTAPSAWTSSSLTSMSSSAFSNCLELMGHDPFLASYQRIEVLKKVIKVYGPVSSFSPSVIAQLGGIAIELSPEELSRLRLTERTSIAALGAVSTWSERQLSALFSTVLNSTKQSASQLDSSILVAMGYIVCGAKVTDMKSFNAVEFSKAVLWLGQLRLACSEEQLLALVGLLDHKLAFGPISSWGADVFIEIGVLAAGLRDMDMSALVKEQIEGITPEAFPMIPSDKFAVVFHQSQISMFSYEQAAAVTEEQLLALSVVQRTALAMVMTPWEDRPVDFRGKSLGLALSHSPLCLILGLLVVLVLPGSDLTCPGT